MNRRHGNADPRLDVGREPFPGIDTDGNASGDQKPPPRGDGDGNQADDQVEADKEQQHVHQVDRFIRCKDQC